MSVVGMRELEIVAPSRLHFGLYAFGSQEGRNFGGVGAMIERPALTVRCRLAECFTAAGPSADRIAQFSQTWRVSHQAPNLPNCRMEVVSAPREHCGFGTGTQLALAVAALLNAFTGRTQSGPAESALSVQRGARSAVGSYGFAAGGLIVERGKLAHEPFSPLDAQISLPAQWRFILTIPRTTSGVYGIEEARAFATLPPVPPRTTARLIELVRTGLLPGALQADFSLFAHSLYEYSLLAGSCFAPIQGGPYHGPHPTALVETLRRLGAIGVGQSSWGPTIFAVTANQNEAEELSRRLAREPAGEDCEIIVTPPAACGARLREIVASES